VHICCLYALIGGVFPDLVQQGLVSSSKPSPAILANDVVGPLLLEVSSLVCWLCMSFCCRHHTRECWICLSFVNS